mmetsp:Transcript_9703/g.22845  ORF Transcript_9703/g.22845 Transcript_9703/m.22845 type:complete len:142 (+) Transcript_9703:1727-2152(+)
MKPVTNDTFVIFIYKFTGACEQSFTASLSLNQFIMRCCLIILLFDCVMIDHLFWVQLGGMMGGNVQLLARSTLAIEFCEASPFRRRNQKAPQQLVHHLHYAVEQRMDEQEHLQLLYACEAGLTTFFSSNPGHSTECLGIGN